MPTIVQFRRGTTAQNNAFTGANGEITVDTDDGRLVLHDGSTAGGIRQALASETIFQVIADDSTGIFLQGGTDELRISGGNNITTSTDSGGSLTVTLDDDVTLSGTLHTTTLDVREILSTDSTFITVNEGLEVLGTIQCNEITSSDSSEVTINNLRTQVITANDSTEILVNDAMRVSGLITGTATQAQYADLAEIFATDDLTLQPGDVVHFSGNKKVGLCDEDAHSSVAGVISTEPGFLLNEGGNGVKLAMTGRVPCKVQGIVEAGDLLVSAGNGRARSESNPAVGTVIGKAIESHNSTDNGVIDIMVTLM